jgi:prephenate dehydratase
MARVTVRVSDLTGNQIPDEQSGARLVVEHPDFSEPIGLDVLAEEVQSHLSEQATRFVVLSLEDPNNPEQQRYVMSIEDFDRLFQTGESTSVLQGAYGTQQ